MGARVYIAILFAARVVSTSCSDHQARGPPPLSLQRRISLTSCVRERLVYRRRPGLAVQHSSGGELATANEPVRHRAQDGGGVLRSISVGRLRSVFAVGLEQRARLQASV